MAAYCSKADLIQRFGVPTIAELTDDTAAASPVDPIIENACDEASSLADGYIAVQYQLPLSSVPTILRKWACDIALFFLWKDRATSDSIVRTNYEDAVKNLTAIAKGLAELPDATGITPEGAGFAIAVVSSPRTFTDDLLNLTDGLGGSNHSSCWRNGGTWPY